MVRRKEDPQTYEEFSRRLAGAKDVDQIPLIDSDGRRLSPRHQKEVVARIGATGLSLGAGGIPMAIFDPPSYGSRFERREADTRVAIRSILPS